MGSHLVKLYAHKRDSVHRIQKNFGLGPSDGCDEKLTIFHWISKEINEYLVGITYSSWKKCTLLSTVYESKKAKGH